MIELTKRSHVAPKMQHVTFCDSIVRFSWCRTKRIDTVCGVTWIPLCARDGSVITWDRGEGETLSHHVVLNQCAGCLRTTGGWEACDAQEERVEGQNTGRVFPNSRLLGVGSWLCSKFWLLRRPLKGARLQTGMSLSLSQAPTEEKDNEKCLLS